MHEIYFSEHFKKSLKKIPYDIIESTEEIIGIMSNNYNHSKLHTKKLQGNNILYSCRVTRDYRLLFYFEKSIIIIHTLKHRKDVYKNIN